MWVVGSTVKMEGDAQPERFSLHCVVSPTKV